MRRDHIHPADMALIRAKLFPEGDPLRTLQPGFVVRPAEEAEPLRICLHAPPSAADPEDPGLAADPSAEALATRALEQLASVVEESAAGLAQTLRARPDAVIGTLRYQLGGANAQTRLVVRDVANHLFPAARIAEEEAQTRRLLDQEREGFLLLRQKRIVYIGAGAQPTAFCILGVRRRDGALVALSLDGGQVIMLGGVPGAGKSQFALCLLEAHLAALPALTSTAHQPTAAVAFVTDDSAATTPELLAALLQNQVPADIERLWEEYRARPQPIRRINLVVPPWQLAEWQGRLETLLDQHAGLRLLPLWVDLSELGIGGLECVINADPEAAFFQRMVEEASDLGAAIDIKRWKAAIQEAADLHAGQRAAAARALRLVERIAAPAGQSLWDLVEPGTLTLFALGGPRVAQQDVMPLCAGLIEALTQPAPRHGAFQRVFLLDEVNRLDGDPRLWGRLVTLGRRIRHRGGVLILLGQDFLKTPDEMLALASVAGTFHMESPRVLSHLREHFGGLSGFRAAQARELARGEVALVVRESTDKGWEGGGVQVVAVRPPLAQHGGHSRSVL